MRPGGFEPPTNSLEGRGAIGGANVGVAGRRGLALAAPNSPQMRRPASVDAGRSALRRLGDERKLLLVQPKQFGSGAACGHRASRRRLVVDDTYLVPGGSQAGSRLLLVPEGATVDRQRKELPLSARQGANGGLERYRCARAPARAPISLHLLAQPIRQKSVHGC